MKKIIVFLALLLGFSVSPAFAKDLRTDQVRIEESTNSYQAKSDNDYWTRIRSLRKARKSKRSKRRVYRNGKKVSYKRRYKKSRRVSKRKRSKRTSSYRRPVSSRNVRPGRGGRILAKVSLSKQRMDVFKGGRLIHSWKVSTGRNGYTTPRGTWRIHRMHKRYFSKKYDNAPMPFAMFYHRGFAVHGTNSIKRLGRTASHGCVRLHPSNAAQLFAMVRRSGGTVKVTN